MLKKVRLAAVVAFVCLLVGGSDSAAAVTVDWRSKGVITPVENQGSSGCNFSWAFAVAAEVASEIMLGQGFLIDLSEQQLIDCQAAGGANQCACPQLGDTFAFIAANGICSGASYPSTAQPGPCQSCAASPVTSTARWQAVTITTEADLIAALNARPLIARLEVGANGQPLPGYLSYSGGVFAPTQWDNSVVQWVQIVGYTNTEFIIKNSLGTGWGESGFMRIARGGNYLNLQSFVYAVTLGGVDAGVPPSAPCTLWRPVPELSPLPLASLVALLAVAGLISLRRPGAESGH